MRRFGTTAGLLAASLMVVAWFSFGQTKEPDQQPTSPPLKDVAEPFRPLFVASSSCAGQGCHGRALPDPLPQSAWEADKDDERWRSSYTIWRAYDPHARAYAVLLEPASIRIAQRLWGPNAKAHEEQRCLSCHSDNHSTRTFQADGVGCQSCHGDAKSWIDSHAGWVTGPGHTDRAVRHGMRDLANASVRSEMCAGCHVGAPATEGMPVRDMNHDMIAAGHPRLNFDYATYVRALPPHWVEKDRNFENPKLRPQADEFAHWLVGRATTNAASLRLLADRSKRGPWPELAEFDCYACHHDLSAKGRPGVSNPPGSLSWNEPPLLTPLLKIVDNRVQTQATNELRVSLRSPVRSPVVAEVAERSAIRWHERSNRWMKDSPSLQFVAESFSEFAPRRWEDACHLFYSLLTMDRVRQPNRSPSELEQINQIRAAIQLPRYVEGSQFQSPKDFDPNQLPFRDLLRSRAVPK